jgi:hypothetical protein
MERPEEVNYEYGWKYKGKNYTSDYEAALKEYTKDLEKYCDWLELQM